MADIEQFGICYRAVKGVGTLTTVSSSTTVNFSSSTSVTAMTAGTSFLFIPYGGYGQFVACLVATKVDADTVTISDAWGTSVVSGVEFWYSTTTTTGAGHLGERLSWTRETSCTLDITPYPESMASEAMVLDAEGYVGKITIEGEYINTSAAYDLGYITLIEAYSCNGTAYQNPSAWVWWNGELLQNQRRAFPVAIENIRSTQHAINDYVRGTKFIMHYTLSCVMRDPDAM